MLWCREAIFEPKGVKLSSFPECRIRTQGLRLQIASRLNACWQTDWAIADKAKTDTRQPILMISGHSSHSTPMPIGFHSWLWQYVCCSMLWHRQAIFKSIEDKLFSPVECRIRIHGLRHQIVSRLNTCWQTDWGIENQAKNLNSTVHPYDQLAFSPLNPISSWPLHLVLEIYIFFVNCETLAQAREFLIETR